MAKRTTTTKLEYVDDRIPPTKILTALSVWLFYSMPAHKCTVEVKGEGDNTRFTQVFRDWRDRKAVHFDSYAMRGAFLSIADPTAAGEFLSSCGPFRATNHGLTFKQIQGWQTFFRSYMISGVEPKGVARAIELEDRERERIKGVLTWDVVLDKDAKRLHGYVNTESAIEAIAATIALDFLEGAKFQACESCKAVFEITKNNGRMFCSQSCAHKAGQKRRRAQAKSEQHKEQRA